MKLLTEQTLFSFISIRAQVLIIEKFDTLSVEFEPAYVMFCAIWYHLYNLKNVKNTHGVVSFS